MTVDLAIEYIRRRMEELGYPSKYMLRLRHLVMQPLEQRETSIDNQLWILVEPPCEIRVESTAGIFDASEDMVNELQYEHRGEVKVTNQSVFLNHVRFIQVIPKFERKECLLRTTNTIN